MGETRVDLVHLLEDLRDAYPWSLEETILTEMMANALDSGARSLRFLVDTVGATLVAVDDGRGMTRRELSRYHDLASTSKQRGRGIGFAGVGIKLGLLASEEVVTETRRERVHAATSWRLANRTRAPWSWIDPPGRLDSPGTAVALRLSNPLSQLLDRGFIETTILRNFRPLFEPDLLEILAPVYPDGFQILIDGRMVIGPIATGDRVPLAIRLGRQRKPSATGYIARHEEPLAEADRGLAICTLGKVIRGGWDWLGLTPADADRIEGLIEVPALAASLTLNKGDFLRTGGPGALFLAYRKAIQEAVSVQLAEWGGAPLPQQRTPRTRPLERDLHRVLGELSSAYPLLATLAERRSGGQRRLQLGGSGANGAGPWSGEVPLHADPNAPEAAGGAGAGADGSPEAPGGAAGGGSGGGESPPPPAASTSPPPSPSDSEPGVPLPGASRRKARARLSLEIRFETLPGDERLARLIESTVWVNDAQPAFRRAAASRSEGYHLALSVASALAPLTVEPARSQEFVNAFLARWGAAMTKAR